MADYAYRVAISFAGEQRAIAEAIAACILKNGGGPVFYDKYEKANLWGKDLYEHLSEVYRSKAEFCIVIASKEYAEKAWTTHERKNAQARALQEKGREYILPVDYDGTKVPGLLDTVGYLSLSDEGPEGICAAFLQKIGVPRSGRSSSVSSPLIVTNSPRALLAAGKTIAFVPVVKSSWGSSASLLLQPDDPTDGPFLDSLRGSRDSLIVAYQQNVGICKTKGMTQFTDDNNAQWDVSLQIDKSDFNPVLESGTSSITAEQFAEQRARRILLNENPARETKDVNEIFLEVLRRGHDSLVKIEKSPFPEIFRTYQQTPKTFLEVAWITAVMQLKLGTCVEIVNQLRLELAGETLIVDFVGTRHRKYSNVDPHVIRIAGKCLLGP